MDPMKLHLTHGGHAVSRQQPAARIKGKGPQCQGEAGRSRIGRSIDLSLWSLVVGVPPKNGYTVWAVCIPLLTSKLLMWSQTWVLKESAEMAKEGGAMNECNAIPPSGWNSASRRHWPWPPIGNGPDLSFINAAALWDLSHVRWVSFFSAELARHLYRCVGRTKGIRPTSQLTHELSESS